MTLRLMSLAGEVPYQKARGLQQFLVEKRIADEIPDTLLFLEHSPVITRGSGLQRSSKPPTLQFVSAEEAIKQFASEVEESSRERHMPLPPLPAGIEFCESERGGDLTYHGPGQLVVYPIIKLDGSGFGPQRDISAFLRKLEQILIDELSSQGLSDAKARQDATGVWVGEKKVASIGIAVRKWVTWHGIAINVVNDLKPFGLFSPCGFQSDVMTRMIDLKPELSESWAEEGWRPWLEQRLAARFAKAVGIGQVVIEDLPLPQDPLLQNP